MFGCAHPAVAPTIGVARKAVSAPGIVALGPGLQKQVTGNQHKKPEKLLNNLQYFT